MKAKTFENLIRKIVREEIDYALHREIKSLKEDLRDSIKPIIKEQSNSISPPIQDNLKEKTQNTKLIPKKPITQQFTSNNALNDLLNQTAQGDTNLERAGMNSVSLSESFTPGTSEDMNTAGLPLEVANAVTRDYSDLMKAIDKKQNK